MYNKSYIVWCFFGVVFFVQFGGKGGYFCYRLFRLISGVIGYRRVI